MQLKRVLQHQFSTMKKTATEFHISYLQMPQKPKYYDKTNTLHAAKALLTKNQQASYSAKYIPSHCFPVYLFRTMYHLVGSEFSWWERQEKSDQELAQILNSPNCQSFVVYEDATNCPVGYVELFTEVNSENTIATCELNYFGLVSAHAGKGIGSELLQRTINTAWNTLDDLHVPTKLVSVNTCNLDHKNAIHVYKKQGFELHHEEFVVKQVPDAVMVSFPIGKQ